MFSGPIYLLHLYLFPNENTVFTSIKENKESRVFFIAIVVIPTMIMFADAFIKGTSIIQTNGSISKNIEIIHPYITENEFLVLRSKLRQIDSKNKTVELIKRIDIAAKKNNIKLDDYNLYGIDN